MDHARRVGELRKRLDHPLLITSLPNIRYLTGFTGSNGFLLMTPDRGTFVTDTRYGEAAEALVEPLPDVEIEVYYGTLYPTLGRLLGDLPAVGLEADHVTWDFVRKLGDHVPGELFPSGQIVEALRLVKDEDEVEALRKAAAAGDAAFASLVELLAGATTEDDLGWGLIGAMRAAGGNQAAWPPIVAAGANASVPHHRAGPDPLGDGLLLLDYGCTVDGYHSDMSRTVWLGADDPDAETQRMYRAVAEAQEAGIAAVKPGVEAGSVDAAAREVLAGYGYEEHFLHSTGHGVGLVIHEGPWARKESRDVLEPGHVLTVEPGVYLPGIGGVRIEDMILVTESGGLSLTNSPKELTIR